MSQLKQYFSYKKFAAEQLRILYLNNNYFLQNETVNVLQQMGHSVQVLPVDKGPREMLEAILKASVALKPDCIMGTNHMGFDPDGQIAAILNNFQLPVLFWYLDDFRFIIRDVHQQAYPNIVIFTFELTDLPLLQKFGFEHVFYLPTASSLNSNANFKNAAYNFLNSRVSFVGSTFHEALGRWNHPDYPGLYNTLSLKDWNSQDISLVSYIIQEQQDAFDSEAQLFHYAGYVAGRSTVELRVDFLNAVDRPVIFGDTHWPETGVQAEIHPPVDPSRTAPQIFNASAINLNISSTQLYTSVNLRIFDTPLSGGFLLTDWKESLADLFDEKLELAVYRSKEEMLDKISYFLNHEEERRQITARAAERIQKEHLLPKRIQEMLDRARTVFGSNV